MITAFVVTFAVGAVAGGWAGWKIGRAVPKKR